MLYATMYTNYPVTRLRRAYNSAGKNRLRALCFFFLGMVAICSLRRIMMKKSFYRFEIFIYEITLSSGIS